MNSASSRRIALVYPQDWCFNRRIERHIAVGEQLDAEMHIICRNLSNGPRTEQVQPRVWVHRLPYLRGIRALSSHGTVFNPFWAATVRRVCAERQIDIVIVREFLLSLSVRAAVPRRIPVIVDEAENFIAMARMERPIGLVNRLWRPILTGAPGRWWERVSVRACDGALVVIEENRDRLISMGVEPSKVHVFHSVPVPELMTPTPQTIPQTNDTHYDMRAAYLGDFNRVRGLPTVVDAVAELRKSRTRVQFILMGNHRKNPEFENRIKERGVASDIVLTGQVRFGDGLGYIQACDVGLVPHTRCDHTDTTIPNKLFDYMYLGKAVVVSDALPLARIVQTHGCGLVFPSGNAGKLAEALAYLAENPEAREVMGRNGRAAIQKEYTWAKTRDGLCQFLKRTMKEEALTHA